VWRLLCSGQSGGFGGGEGGGEGGGGMLGGHEGVGPGTAATLRSCMPDKTLEKAKVQRHVWTIGALSTVLARTTPSPRLGTRLWAHCRPPLLLSPAHHSRPCSLRHITIGLVMQPRWGMHVKQRAAARARIEDAPRPGGWFQSVQDQEGTGFYLAFKGPAAEGEGLIGCTTVVSGSPR